MMDNNNNTPQWIKDIISFNCDEIDKLMYKVDGLKCFNRRIDSKEFSNYEKYKDLLYALRDKTDGMYGMAFMDDGSMACVIINGDQAFPDAQEKKEMIDYVKKHWDKCRFKSDNMTYVEEFGEENENLYWDVNKRDDLILMWCEIVVAKTDYC